MLQENLNDINTLNEQIEKALEDSDFVQLAFLSNKLQSVIEMSINNSSYKMNAQKQELDVLKDLLIRVNKYQLETEEKFKDYTSKTSKQTKMQNAYKQSRG